MLFNVSVTDPLAFVGAPTMLLHVALLASFSCARRAATVDPLIALRNSGAEAAVAVAFQCSEL
jgi:hypothetical protein